MIFFFATGFYFGQGWSCELEQVLLTVNLNKHFKKGIFLPKNASKLCKNAAKIKGNFFFCYFFKKVHIVVTRKKKISFNSKERQ